MRQAERQGGVVQGMARGEGNRARHVRHAIMDDAVDLVSRVGMRGRHARSRSSRPDRSRHRPAPRPSASISASRASPASGRWRRGREPRRSRRRRRTPPVRSPRWWRSACATRPSNSSSSSRSRGIERSRIVTSAPSPAAIRAAWVPTTPPPSTTTRAGTTPGTPPSRRPRPPALRFKRRAGRFDREPAGDFAHGREQGQAALGVGDRLIGDRGAAGSHQALGLLRIRRQMQIGEEDLAFAQLRSIRAAAAP